MAQNPLQSIRIGTLVDGTLADPAHYIRTILPHGFESFQLTFGAGIELPDLDRLSAEVLEVLDGSGAVISALGVYGNPLVDTEEAQQTQKAWKTLLEKASLFKTDVVAGFTGRVPGAPIDDSIPVFSRVFDPIVSEAGSRNVKVAFENCAMGGDWQSGNWNIAHGPDAWELIFDAFPEEHVGLEWEPCHQMINLIDPIPQLREWMPRMIHIHGKCATIHHDVIEKYGVRGSKWFAYHRTPGFGDADWTDILSALRDGEFAGSIDIEGWHDPVYKDELEMTGQVSALHYLKKCRGGEYVPNPPV